MTPVMRRLGGMLSRSLSVRSRLMLWNVGALAIILVVLGLLVRYEMEANMMRSVDDELSTRPRPGGPGLSAMIDGFHGGHHEGIAVGGFRVAGPFVFGEGPSKNPPDHPPGPFGMVHRGGRPFSSDQNDVNRPRTFDTQGKSIAPFSNDKPWDLRALRRAAQGESIFSTVSVAGEPIRVFSAPLSYRGKVMAVSQVGHSLADVNQAVADMNRTLLTLIPVALLLAGVGGALMTKRALGPVQQMADTAQAIGAHDLSRRLAVVGKDEFSQLAATFNAMLARLDVAFSQEKQLVQELETLVEQQRRFTADASHELRTPLTIVKATTSLCQRRRPTREEYEEAIEDIDRAADRMSRLVQDLLLLARGDNAQLARSAIPLPVSTILEEAAASLRSKRSAPIQLEISDPSLTILGDADEIRRVFINLLENAVRYTPAEGAITVATRRDGERVKVTVTDSGSGIPPAHLPHVFERFYRVDSARSREQGGTGLGLAICKSIVEAHHGTITIGSKMGKGTTVTVCLPLSADDSEIGLPTPEIEPVLAD